MVVYFFLVSLSASAILHGKAIFLSVCGANMTSLSSSGIPSSLADDAETQEFIFQPGETNKKILCDRIGHDYSPSLKWKNEGGENILQCKPKKMAEAGDVCVKLARGGLKLILKFGTIEKGSSDGVYTCYEYYRPHNIDEVTYSKEVIVTVRESVTTSYPSTAGW